MHKILLIIMVLFTILPSCSMAPRREEVSYKFTIPDSYLTETKGVSGNKLTAAFWWKGFNDERLNHLIDTAIKNNLNLKVAISRVKAVEAQFDITKRMQGPKMSASTGTGYGRYPKPGFSSGVDPTTGQPTFSQTTKSAHGPNYSLNMGLQFELDIWGRLYSLKQSALAQLISSQYELQGAFLTIIAQTTTLYYNITALQRQIELSRLTLATYEYGYKVEVSKYIKGIGQKLNVSMAKQNIEGARVQLETLNQALKLQQHQMATLLGAYPKEIMEDKTDILNYLPPFDEIPAGLPADLMKNRADLKGAEQRMEAARYQIGAAKADLFPKISLTAALGYLNVSEIKNLFTSDYLSSSVGASVDYSFASGSKYAVLAQKRALYEQSIFEYKKDVLNAFKEVEDAMVQMMSTKKQREITLKQIESAKESAKIYARRYQQGLAPYDKVLEFERFLFQARTRLIDIEKNMIIARINFHRALGGNWLDEPEIKE